MIQYKCKNCGGEVNISVSGGMKCPFCGSKFFMSDKDYRGNLEFRKKFLEYIKAEAKNKEFDYNSDNFWEGISTDKYVMSNGQDLNIQYMYKYDYDKCVCYIAKESVVYVFENDVEKEKFKNGLQKLVFPEADDKLHRCFPKLKMELPLKDGKEVLVYIRRPNFFPAELFAPWESVHLAWVISRMENICCALEYSEIRHGGINSSSVWINPLTHEGALFGDWRNVESVGDNKDLVDLRKTAIELAKNARNPLELYEFVNSKPQKDAFEDFAAWDRVIEKGFGGHNFVKM